jgi:hypothetical protein
MTTILKDGRLVESAIESQGELVLDNKVIPLWLIVFDQDPTKSYICTTKNKVLASVEGAIRGTYGDESDLINPVIDKIEKTWGQQFINLKCPPSLDLFVHRLEIDKHNPIGRILMECYHALPYNSLRARIAKLFVEPAA